MLSHAYSDTSLILLDHNEDEIKRKQENDMKDTYSPLLRGQRTKLRENIFQYRIKHFLIPTSS